MWAAPAAGGGNDPRIQTIYRAAAAALTGTTIQNVVGMSFPVVALGTYIFTMYIDVTAVTGTSPTHNYSFALPTGYTRFMAKRTQMTSATAQVTSVVTGTAGFGAGAVVANIKTILEGIIVVGATGGTVQLQVTQGGTAPTVTLGAGSGGFAMKTA